MSQSTAPPPSSPVSPPPDATSVSTRFALLIALSLLCSGVVGVLTWIAGRHPAEALLAALLALGGSYKFFDSFISH